MTSLPVLRGGSPVGGRLVIVIDEAAAFLGVPDPLSFPALMRHGCAAAGFPNRTKDMR